MYMRRVAMLSAGSEVLLATESAGLDAFSFAGASSFPGACRGKGVEEAEVEATLGKTGTGAVGVGTTFSVTAGDAKLAVGSLFGAAVAMGRAGVAAGF